MSHEPVMYVSDEKIDRRRSPEPKPAPPSKGKTPELSPEALKQYEELLKAFDELKEGSDSHFADLGRRRSAR